MASRRSPFMDAAETTGHYMSDSGYIYQVPRTYVPVRTTPAPVPVGVSEDRYSQYTAAPAPPTYNNHIYSTCCRRPRRASRYLRVYDSEGSTDSYASSEDDAAQSEYLPPRIALKNLSDYLQEASAFYNKQLTNFTREHQLKGHDASNDALRQWLWKDWVGRLDDSIREEFRSTKTSITIRFRQLKVAVATPWLDNADLKARFEFSFETLQSMCGEIVRLADKAEEDWQACRFLAVELKNAKVYANPDGDVQKHLFGGWEKGEIW